jgi:Family of unknown function (DUF6492)
VVADTVTAPRFALVTPSYYVDFERCRFLCESVARFVPEHVPHYIIIDRADQKLFAPLASPRTRLVLKEDVLRGRLHQLPFARRWWVGTRSLPVRGWIVQQIIKLSMHEVAKEDALVFVDSGSFFVRPWDPSSTLRDGQVPLFYDQGSFYLGDEMTQQWHRGSSKLLGLRPTRTYDLGYINALVTWRRDNLIMLHRHIESVTGGSSFDALCRMVTLSEYHVYGMYCDRVLADRARQYRTSTSLSLAHWPEETLDAAAIRRMLAEKLRPEHVLVLINEKSHTSLGAVREAFADL